jgi:4-hydroxythreonine-4-phosphate dehydrogenase
LVLALGDPAGIGTEVTLKALARPWPPGAEITLVGCRQWLEQSYVQLKHQGVAPLADPAELKVVNLPLDAAVRCGHSDAVADAGRRIGPGRCGGCSGDGTDRQGELALGRP